MGTVGLFERDTFLHYIDYEFVVLNNPYNGGKPVIVMRTLGNPNLDKVKEVLRKIHFELVGEPSRRSDGLWYQEVKETGDESRS